MCRFIRNEHLSAGEVGRPANSSLISFPLTVGYYAILPGDLKPDFNPRQAVQMSVCCIRSQVATRCGTGSPRPAAPPGPWLPKGKHSAPRLGQSSQLGWQNLVLNNTAGVVAAQA